MAKQPQQIPVALTVAGSDSGGGAGIQADLKTFHTLGVFGTCAITCLTAQNPAGVSAVQPGRPRIVAEQLARIFEAFPVRAAKTGMLYDAAIIATVARCFHQWRARRLVVDPVMVASSGALLLKKDAVAVLIRQLLPLATVVTPNLAEAEVLWGRPIRSLADLRTAAVALAERHGVPFLVKGGHLHGVRRAVDVLYDGRQRHEFVAARQCRIRTHGTGCTFAAAITAYLAHDMPLPEAVGRAKRFVTHAIRTAYRIGRYRALRV